MSVIDYSGPCFIEYIDTMLPSISRDYEGPIRVIIADKYSVGVSLLIIYLFFSHPLVGILFFKIGIECVL